jgi:hypothetical protein
MKNKLVTKIEQKIQERINLGKLVHPFILEIYFKLVENESKDKGESHEV